MSNFWKVFITVIISVVVIGGGGYYLIKKNSEENKELQSKINDLSGKVADLTGVDESTTGSVATTGSIATTGATVTTGSAVVVTPVTSWKTYTTDQGFSIKYPADFVVKQLADQPGFNISITPTGKTLSANVFELDLKLNIGEAMTLQELIKTVSGTNQGKAMVGSSSGVKFLKPSGATTIYWSNASDNQVSAIINRSNVLKTSNEIVSSEKTSYDTIFDSMIATFAFTK